MLKMNFDKIIGSLVNENGRYLRVLTPEEKVVKSQPYIEDEGQRDHPIPPEYIPASGIKKYRTGALTGNTDLRGAAVSKKHLDQTGGYVNDRVDTFRAEVRKRYHQIDNSNDEMSLYNVSKSLNGLLAKLQLDLKNENTEIPLKEDDFTAIKDVIKNVRSKIESKVNKFTQIQKGQLHYNWKRILAAFDDLIRKNYDNCEELIKSGSHTRNQGAESQHFFSLDLRSTFDKKTGKTYWIIYTKKSNDEKGNYVKGNLPLIRNPKIPNIWAEPLPDVRKGNQKPPTLWVNGIPQYGKPLPKELRDRNKITLQNGQKVTGTKIDEFLQNVGHQIIFDVIVAKYWDKKTGVHKFGNIEINLDKLVVAPYGVKIDKLTADIGTVPVAFHQKRQKRPVGSIGGGTTSTVSNGSSVEETQEEPQDIEGEEDEF